MSVSSGSDITIPIQDSPPPPPSPYAGTNGGSKGNDASSKANKSSKHGVGGTVTIIDTSAGGGGDAGGRTTPEPRGDVTVTVGFVNEAYQDHSPDQQQHSEKNGHTTKMMTNGQKKSSNGAISISVPGEVNEKNGASEHQEIQLNEAVNPELINMNILNTIPDKPNPEYGPYDNMDEYFVPVNQHKKFLRSEKLYVTKDKRKESHWKKYVCWVLGASILAAIVTVAVLAGIGLIPQKSPNHFESSVGTTSAAETDDLFSEDAIISSSSESSLPSSTEINTPPSVPVDATYVPMAAEIQFTIIDLAYEPALNDKTSERFQQLSGEVQEKVKDMLKARAGLEVVYSRVTEFAPGSVVVKMRVGWLDQGMDLSTVRMALSNVTSVGQYNINPISSYEIVNFCKFNKNGCSHNCSYSYKQLDFYCSCGEDKTLVLADDNKTCRSIYDVHSSTTTSEIPLLPEFSSYSPSSVSEEESSPAPPPSSSSSSEELVPEEDQTEVPENEPEQPQPTNQPVEHFSHDEQEDLSAAVSHEPESSTEANLPAETFEPVSHEHHHQDEEMIPIMPSSTTSTVAPVESVSEEVIEQGHHHENHENPSAIVPVETTTPSATSTSTTATPEPLPNLFSSQEATYHEQSDEQETTINPVVPVSSSSEVHSLEHETSNGSTEQSVSSAEQHHQLVSSAEDLQRPDQDESVHPTDPMSPISSEVHQNSSSENATIVENVRDITTSSEVEENIQPEVVPTEPPSEIEQDVPTISPVIDERAPIHVTEDHDDTKSAVPSIEDEEITTALSADENDESLVATTVTPAIDESVKQEELHDITPLDVLKVSSTTHEASSTTPTPPVVHAQSEEINQGRSVSSSRESGSEEVEHINHGTTASGEDNVQSQNLMDDDEERATEANGNRAPRLFSTELANPNQLLEETDQGKSGEHEEVVVPVEPSREQEVVRPINSNVTESASVETADENPEMASAVTKTSSEDTTHDGASREAATVPVSGSENESSQPVSGSNESINNNLSQGLFSDSSSASFESSDEVSQESPVQPQLESDSGESTTFAPLSLHHDIDINYLGNNTEDRVNSEPIQVLPEVETVESEHVANQESEKTSDKLIVPASVEEDQEALPTTLSPDAVEPVEREELAGSQEENPQVPASGERGESADEVSGTTTRGISAASIFGNEESLESPNRDHRDTNADIETPFASRISTESQENEPVTTEVHIAESSTTVSSTTTSTTTTSAPIPEVPLADLSQTTTSTASTTSSTTTMAPVASNNNTKSDNLSSSSSSEPPVSGSQEESSSNSQLHSHEGLSSSSPEDKSVSEPTFSASYEGQESASTSLESRGDEDLHHNELT